MPESFGRRIYLILFGLIFLSMIILTIHFREGENGPIHKAQRGVMAATAPLQSLASSIFSPVRDGWDYLIHFGQLKRENRTLAAEVAKLRSRQFELETLRKENERLKALAGYKNEHRINSIAARIIGMPSSNWWSAVIIDKGAEDGVQRSMPVLAGGGLVGQISAVAPNVSKIILLNDVQSGVSVQDERTGEIGVLKGRLREKNLSLQYVSRDSSIRKGDAVVTSGLGGIFPKGIYIGKVAEVKEPTYSLYKVVGVTPAIDFTTLNEVLVLKQNGDPSSLEEDN